MIDILGFSIRLYGVLVAVGVFCSAKVSSWVAQKEGMKESDVWDALTYVIVPGVFGARMYHVIDQWQYYWQRPLSILAVWEGGIGIFGALLGGSLGLMVFVKRKYPQEWREQLWKLLDVAAIGLPLGQAIGRWGNYFNMELFGLPSRFNFFPLAVFIPKELRPENYSEIGWYQPIFLYESLLSLIIFGILVVTYNNQIFMKDKKLTHTARVGSGVFVWMYLIGYGSVRLFLDRLRVERWEVGDGIAVAAIVGVVMVIGGIVGLAKALVKVRRSV